MTLVMFMAKYIPLMYELYAEFNNNKTYRELKQILILSTILTFISTILGILNCLIFNSTYLLIIVYLLFFIEIAIFIVFYITIRKHLFTRVGAIIDRFHYLLKQPKYCIFDNITMLNELEQLFTSEFNKFNGSNFNIFSKKVLEIMGSLSIGYLLSFIVNTNATNFNILIISSIITMIFTIIVNYYAIRAMIRFESKDLINTFLLIVKERRLEIINSRNDSLTNKIAYFLKLGKFS